MKKISVVLCLFCLVILNNSCQKEVSDFGSPDIIDLPHPITATVQGNIFDENDLPMADVIIKTGTKTTTTNANGFFRITNAALDKISSLVTAEKSNYFKGFRVFSATSGANYVRIKLMPKTLAGSVDASAGGEITIDGVNKINLPAGGIVTASGAAYSGTVKVFATKIDPTRNDIASIIPGSYQDTDKDGKAGTLASYGMMGVELESNSGEKLQIKTGYEATLTTAIPTSILATAPSSISLWYLDALTGIWKEEGSAIKAGNSYVGTVKHFTWWNCDFNLPGVQVSLRLLTPAGIPITQATVWIEAIDVWGIGHGFTDSAGRISNRVPANLSLRLKIFDDCNHIVFTEDLGPFSQDVNLGDLTVMNLSNPFLSIIHGIIADCNNAPVIHGSAEIQTGYETYYVSTNSSGEFDLAIMNCNPALTISIRPVDYSAQQEGALQVFSLSNGTLDAGTLTACGISSLKFLNYTLDGTSHSLINSNSGDYISISNYPGISAHTLTANNATDYFQVIFDGAAAGTVPVTSLIIQNLRADLTATPLNINLTHCPSNATDFFEGNSSGTFIDSLNVTHTLSYNFRAH